MKVVKKGPKKRDKAKAKGGDSKGKALPTKKKKRASSEEDDDKVDGDGKKKANEAKVKWPASMPKKSKTGGNSDDAMEVDSEPAPKPKVKAVTKVPKGDEGEPAMMKQKKTGRLMSVLLYTLPR
jgi:hypothetical protein